MQHTLKSRPKWHAGLKAWERWAEGLERELRETPVTTIVPEFPKEGSDGYRAGFANGIDAFIKVLLGES